MKQYYPVRFYPNDRGLHFEFATEGEAIEFYEDGMALGDRQLQRRGNTVADVSGVPQTDSLTSVDNYDGRDFSLLNAKKR